MKATNTRALVPYILDHQRRATEMHNSAKNNHMLKVVEGLHGAYDIFYNNDCFLTRRTVASLRAHLLSLGQHYQYLSMLTFAEGKPRWKSTHKMHYVVAHLADQAALLNPRYVQGYGSESMVGQMCNVYKASKKGPVQSLIQEQVMLKYRVGMTLMWK